MILVIIVVLVITFYCIYKKIDSAQSKTTTSMNNERASAPSHTLPPISKRPVYKLRSVTALPAPGKTMPSKITEYPHCPKCWSCNRVGESQRVFYDATKNNYYCTRGHHFKKNGTLC